jgi:hypothetical protein
MSITGKRGLARFTMSEEDPVILPKDSHFTGHKVEETDSFFTITVESDVWEAKKS